MPIIDGWVKGMQRTSTWFCDDGDKVGVRTLFDLWHQGAIQYLPFSRAESYDCGDRRVSVFGNPALEATILIYQRIMHETSWHVEYVELQTQENGVIMITTFTREPGTDLWKAGEPAPLPLTVRSSG